MELILRFFAFFFHSEQYQSPMKGFLNRYMATNRNLQKQSETDLRELFGQTVKVIADGIGPKAFRPRRAVNAAVVDSLMTGIAKRLTKKPVSIKNFEELNRRFDQLLKDPNYISAIETGTSQEANVSTRLKKAEAAFAQIT